MNLRIENPCTEGWNTMQTLEGGKFCDACKCKVHDFTNATADDIKLQYELNNGKLCGHVPAKLLVQQFQQAAIRKGYFHNLKIFCWAALLGFGACLFSIPAANANGMLRQLRSKILSSGTDTNATVEITVKGVVRDKKNKEELPFANVAIFVNDTFVKVATTNVDGRYELKIDPVKYPKFDLRINYVAYKSSIIKNVKPVENRNLFIDVELDGGEVIIDGLMIMDVESYPQQDPFQSGKTVRRREYRRMPKR